MLQDNGDCWQHILLKVNQYSVVRYAQTQQRRSAGTKNTIFDIGTTRKKKNIVAKSKTNSKQLRKQKQKKDIYT